MLKYNSLLTALNPAYCLSDSLDSWGPVLSCWENVEVLLLNCIRAQKFFVLLSMEGDSQMTTFINLMVKSLKSILMNAGFISTY